MRSRKVERAQESFRREISSVIFSMKDPRVHRGLLTVSKVEVSNDCIFCKAYISCVEGINFSRKICKILNRASGFVQSSVAFRLKARVVPKILFLPDKSEEYAFKMSKIIKNIVKNNKVDLDKVSDFLRDNDNFAIYTHVVPDGDAVGSIVALGLSLKQLGKKVKLVYDDEFPEKLRFLLDLMDNGEDFIPEKFICLDVSDKKRIGKFEDQNFDLCVDHHKVDECEFPKMAFIDKNASSCCEIIYILLKKVGININCEIATCIYAGIASDTGNFRFSNVNSRVFEIMLEIFPKVKDFSGINNKLSGGISKNFMKFQGEIISRFEYFGTCCLSIITLNDIKKYGIKYSELDIFSQIPLKISGVELSVIAKEKFEGVFRISVRSVSGGRALKLCKIFSGGGHPDAAGCEILGDRDFIRNKILDCLDREVRFDGCFK